MYRDSFLFLLSFWWLQFIKSLLSSCSHTSFSNLSIKEGWWAHFTQRITFLFVSSPLTGWLCGSAAVWGAAEASWSQVEMIRQTRPPHVYSEGFLGLSGRRTHQKDLISHIQQSFSHILRDVGNKESEWAREREAGLKDWRNRTTRLYLLVGQVLAGLAG